MCKPWRIQVIRKEAQKKLGEIYVDIFKRENPDAEQKLIDVEYMRPQRAPIMLAVSSHPNMEKAARIPLMEQKLSGGAVCMNILHAATALGYASQWITQWPAYHPEVKQALGHTPETQIFGFIFIGTASEPPTERMRPDLDEIVTEWPKP
jgi:nitroreductase